MNQEEPIELPPLSSLSDEPIAQTLLEEEVLKEDKEDELNSLETTQKVDILKTMRYEVKKVDRSTTVDRIGNLESFDKDTWVGLHEKGKVYGKKPKNKDSNYFQIKSPYKTWYIEVADPDIDLKANGMTGQVFHRNNLLVEGIFVSEKLFLTKGRKEAIDIHQMIEFCVENLPLHFTKVEIDQAFLQEMLYDESKIQFYANTLYANLKKGKAPSNQEPLMDFNRYVGKYHALGLEKVGDSLMVIKMGDSEGFNKLIVFNIITLESVHRIDFKELSKKGSLQIDGQSVVLSKDNKKNIERINISEVSPLSVSVKFKNQETVNGRALAKDGELLIQQEADHLIKYINLTSNHQIL